MNMINFYETTKEEILEDFNLKVAKAKSLMKKDYNSDLRREVINLRKEFEEIYKFFSKKKNKDLLDIPYLRNYNAYVTDCVTSITGPVSRENYSSFLYGVVDYSNYYFRRDRL